MSCVKKMLQLYAVTDRAWVGTKSFEQQILAAITGGITCLQLREKNLSTTAYLDLANQVGGICKKFHIPFIINDNIEVAIKSNADGIHVGQNDFPLQKIREQIGSQKIIGVSVQSVEQALAAVKNGADYLGVGAVFPTQTKKDAMVLSKQLISDICEVVNIPIVAIGGLSKNNLNQLKGLKIDGMAFVSAIFAADDISKECRLLKQLVAKILKLPD